MIQSAAASAAASGAGAFNWRHMSGASFAEKAIGGRLKSRAALLFVGEE